MYLHRLSLDDRDVVEKYLGFAHHELAVYAFANIYIWQCFFNIQWMSRGQNLLVFFTDEAGCFVYLAILNDKSDAGIITDAFDIMATNRNEAISRIENVEEKDLAYYENLGYTMSPKYGDYLCKTLELADIKGNKFKAQRACYNYFVKHHRWEYCPYSLQYRESCCRLYEQWMALRKEKYTESVYRGMLEDSYNSLQIALDHWDHLNLTGRLVKIHGVVKAFTFGFPLNPEIFCILYEITDLAIKGLAQFIFREFCRELSNYSYINIMDDSGLPNLSQVKVRYRPVRIIPNYIIQKPHILR